MPDQRLLICPYCGETQPESDRCRACAGLFEPLSRQATHNAMGPWFIRDEQHPFRPGCSYETLVKLIQRGRVSRYTIVRGPTTRQFWTIAKRVPGISHYFRACYQCDASVDAEDRSCHACGASFGGFLDRNFLGLPEYRPLPWEDDRSGARRPDVEPGEPSDWRQQSAPAGGGPRGISSFATDEELFSDTAEDSAAPGRADSLSREPTGSASASSAERAATAIAADPAEAQPEATLAPEELAEAAPSPVREPARDAAIHALQQSIARQRRTIRGLAYTAIAIGAVGVIIALLWLDVRSSKDHDADSAAHESAPTEDAWDLPALDSDATRNGAGAADIEPPDPPRDGDAADDPPSPLATFTDEHRAAYAEALDLIERAADDEQPLSSRTADLERAIAALDRLQREVDESALPEHLPRKLREARRSLERLRLQEFFP